MREIDLYVALTGNKNNFKFLSVVIDEEGEKEVYKELEETTSNRAIIVGISEVLKEECDNLQINIHTPTNFGFRYMNKLKENKIGIDKKYIDDNLKEYIKDKVKVLKIKI